MPRLRESALCRYGSRTSSITSSSTS